jgi:ABC-type phosphate transport system auxiliary subunit
MGDAGEGLIDAEARIQERMDERELTTTKKGVVWRGDPELLRQVESLRLARTEMQRQLHATAHDARKKQLQSALGELETRLKALQAQMAPST